MIYRIAAGAGFLACITAANYATAHYGMVPVGFGVVATAGTYLAGVTFVLRDVIQDLGGKALVLVFIVIGAAMSLLIAPAALAVASGVAFLCSETADLAVYTPLRERGYVRAAVASNVVGAFVDTVIFLAIAGFPIWASVTGQMLGKLAITLAVVVAVALARAARRESVPA
jgi:uncharacterized PurR-regulated membrane protein YhhQ (DUF165 family)